VPGPGDLFDRAMGGTRTVAPFVPPTLPVEAQYAGSEEIAELREALDGPCRTPTEPRVRLSGAGDRPGGRTRGPCRAESLIGTAEQAKTAYTAETEDLRAQTAELRVAREARYGRQRLKAQGGLRGP